MTRAPTYTGEECLNAKNLVKELKTKHSLIKQATVIDESDEESQNRINAGPQSSLLNENTIDNLHKASFENSHNFSSFLNSTSQSLERRVSKGVIDWEGTSLLKEIS